jgi:hypothetical protein
MNLIAIKANITNGELYLYIGFTLLLLFMCLFVIFIFVSVNIIKRRQRELEIILYDNLKKLLDAINTLKKY